MTNREIDNLIKEIEQEASEHHEEKKQEYYLKLLKLCAYVKELKGIISEISRIGAKHHL
jgi:hypothetical protein